MFKREYFRRIGIPAILLFVSLVFIHCYSNPSFQSMPSFIIGSNCVSAFIAEIFAYITCWVFVLRREKSDGHIWINYIVWFLIMTLGTFHEMGLI